MQTAFQRLCRTCLYTSKNITEFISISTIDPVKRISTKCKIEMCIPEIDVEDPDSTFLCAACWNALNTSYNFKCVCLATEEKLRKGICELEGDITKCRPKNVLFTEIDLLLDDILTTNKTRTDLYRQTKFFLETQKIIKKYCSSQKTSNSPLKKHKPKVNKLSNHSADKSKWRCKRCFKEFLDARRFKCHVNVCGHFIGTCKKCLKGFYFKKTYARHIQICKGATKNTTRTKVSKKEVATRIVKQTEISKEVAREIVKQTETSKKEVATPLKQECKKNSLISDKSSPVNKQTNVKSFECSVCSKMFRSKWHLKRHAPVHSRKNRKWVNNSTVNYSILPYIQSYSQTVINENKEIEATERVEKGEINDHPKDTNKRKETATED